MVAAANDVALGTPLAAGQRVKVAIAEPYGG
jgi:hypothetical protein